MFKDYFFVLQYAPFRLAIKPISEAEKHHIAVQYGLFRMTKWAISERETCFSGLCYGVYQNVVRTGMGFTMLYLTFVYISFEKIFCQNSVKKNCKYVSGVLLRSDDAGGGKWCGKCAWPVCGRLIDSGDADLLLRGASAVDVRINRCRNQVFRYSQTFHI